MNTDRKELLAEVKSMTRRELIDFFDTYYGNEDYSQYSTYELRQVYVDGQLC